MEAEQREKRRRKYLSLGIAELSAAIVFLLVALLFVVPRLPDTQDQVALWCALTPLLVTLVVAALYWILARTWVGRSAMPVALATTFRALRATVLALLCAGLIGVVVWWPIHLGVAVFVVVVWVFAVLEYVNYFVLRLSYPVRQWLPKVMEYRTPQLVTDMRASSLAFRRTQQRNHNHHFPL